MIISKIATGDFIYFNLHAEEVVTSNYIANDCSGIYGDRLQIVTLERIQSFVSKKNLQAKNLVLDFDQINACQQNLNKILFKFKNADNKVLLINLRKSLCEELALTSFVNKKNVEKGDVYKKFYLFDDAESLFTEVEVNVPSLFDEAFKEKITKYIESHGKPHTSSYIYLTSYVDIKKFISHEKEFMLFALYKLAIKIRREWKPEMDQNPILICQSMNSAYIVSVLSNLLKLDILILDKIGPINKLYNRLDNRIMENRKYIVVADLVCLGTEVKIVKNLIQFIGGKFLGNVALIKTETLKKSDIKRTDATIAVFSINRSNNKELNYNITTDLEAL